MNDNAQLKLRSIKHRLHKLANPLRFKNVISLRSRGNVLGSVLLSYLTEPFLTKPDQLISAFHTNQWESLQIAQTFLELGYCVDVINWNDQAFKPQKSYSFFIDIHINLERLAPLLNKDCIKILHITGAHWLFQNQAEYSRLLALQQRRKVTLKPRRQAPPSLGIEYADYATILGNKFTTNTFTYSQKPIYRIPISTTATYPWFQSKSYETCRNKFLWLGSSGMVHKGLDLVLEAFSEMPHHHLTVCGPISNEKDFEDVFYKELYQTQNIKTLGWINVNSPEFTNIVKSCIGVVYPSCSEGGGGSVVTCMHAGLIPIVSYESSVDVEDFGVTLSTCCLSEIKNKIKYISSLPAQDLHTRSRRAWEFARTRHTKEKFSEEYLRFVKNILKDGTKAETR
jgi:glycosyltransferase involved in cell wall biosynthesis